jgi:L-ascorbate metabolism protein UlaG (beta-lactamase superfamily)
VLYDGVRDAAARVRPDVVLLHVGAVRFPVTGPLHYTLTADEAVTLCDVARPRIVVPVHYEGWKHFSQGRAQVERAFAGTPHEVRWLPIGEPTDLEPYVRSGPSPSASW